MKWPILLLVTISKAPTAYDPSPKDHPLLFTLFPDGVKILARSATLPQLREGRPWLPLLQPCDPVSLLTCGSRWRVCATGSVLCPVPRDPGILL